MASKVTTARSPKFNPLPSSPVQPTPISTVDFAFPDRGAPTPAPTPTSVSPTSPHSPPSPVPVSPTLPLLLAPQDLDEPLVDTVVTLWRAWPVDFPDVRKGMALTALVEVLDSQPAHHPTPQALTLFHAQQAQAARIMRLMILETHWKNLTVLDPECARNATMTPTEWVKANKQACQVVKMETAVATGATFNEQGNVLLDKGKPAQAIVQYLKALSALCPWSSDASIMTFDQVRASGLAALEQEVLLNIARAGLALSLLLPDNPVTSLLTPTLVDTALQSFNFMPFTTYGSLIAHSDLLAECLERWPKYIQPDRKSLFERRRAAKSSWEKQPSDGWAHHKCGMTNVCYKH
ncbi:hypothetical protein IAT38_002930 [Cryptococcus sp. DSM 104549]